MKKLSKVLVLVLSAIMVLAMSASVFAATGSITITPPSNSPADASNSYKVYKVFDAVASEDGKKISYKVMESKNGALPVVTGEENSFFVDGGGNVHYGKRNADGSITDATELTAKAIAAIGEYVKGDTPVATPTSTGTAAATATNLANGYYYITTSTGTVVTIDSTKPNANVNDKNEITPPDKKITGVGDGSLDEAGQKALAEVGTIVSYEATVTKSKGAKNIKFHDTMGSGLTYNGDAKVYNGTTEVTSGVTVGKEGNDTFTVVFTDEFMSGLEDNTKLTIKYSATVNSDALTVDTGKNTASISYGDNNNVVPSPNTPQVYNAKITVKKVDGEKNPLAGAGFVLIKDNKFYQKSGNDINWVDDVKDATVLTTEVKDGVAQVVFTGLAAGTYTLHEQVTPDGYNTAADKTITVKDPATNNMTTDLALETEVINESGAVLPGTGGIGTTIFYVLGTLLVVGCGIVLVSRRRMENNK